jgi:hypothetical protein
MDSLATVIAAQPGPPLAILPMNLTSAFVPAVVALVVFAVVGAVVVLVGRDGAWRTTRSRTAQRTVTARAAAPKRVSWLDLLRRPAVSLMTGAPRSRE